MQIGEVSVNQHTLRSKTMGDKKGLLIGDTGKMLVKISPDAPGGYDLVDKVESAVPADEFNDSYGIWEDKPHGALWWKKPKDGVIQEDEVTPAKALYQGQHWVVTCPSGSPFPGHHVGCALEDRNELWNDSASLTFKQTTTGPIAVLEERTECLDNRPYY